MISKIYKQMLGSDHQIYIQYHKLIFKYWQRNSFELTEMNNNKCSNLLADFSTITPLII